MYPDCLCPTNWKYSSDFVEPSVCRDQLISDSAIRYCKDNLKGNIDVSLLCLAGSFIEYKVLMITRGILCALSPSRYEEMTFPFCTHDPYI